MGKYSHTEIDYLGERDTMYFKNTLSNSYKNFYTGTKRIKFISEIAGLLSKNLCLHIAPSSKNYEVFSTYFGVLFRIE